MAGETVWTNEPTTHWEIDNGELFGAEEEGVGAAEWKGWSFADKDWWVQTAGDLRRAEFARGQGNVAIADPDEWDDIGGPGRQEQGGNSKTGPQRDFSPLPPPSIPRHGPPMTPPSEIKVPTNPRTATATVLMTLAKKPSPARSLMERTTIPMARRIRGF